MVRLADFIEKTNSVKTVSEVFSVLEKTMANGYGYSRVAFGTLSDREICADGLPEPAVALNYPPDWIRHYHENDYGSFDPIVTLTPSMRYPFIWDRLSKMVELEPRQELLLQESKEAGLHEGLSIPIHGPFGDCFVVSLASWDGGTDPDRHLSEFQVIASQFHMAYMSLLKPVMETPVRLTPREGECLVWSARGKSTWAIGEILKISEHTVKFHLANAMGKLGTTNRVIAVVKALRRGLIAP